MPSTSIRQESSLHQAEELGLNEEEYSQICSILERKPNLIELGIYSALWSEHCSYKNSILLLKTFPSESEHSLAKAGEENAGVLDIGDGLAVVFKIESHNHPTALEPYQGAATGVGGIMRDIFTMGARPICSLNSLRFGHPSHAKSRSLFSRAVKGIGDYGNSLGIPVMGGEVFFDRSFRTNCLVNAMAVGIVRHEDLSRSSAEGVGKLVYLVGARTGRDGIHGASFASADLSSQSSSRRSAVQVGDPFSEKLLMEVALEISRMDGLIGMQDLGAAGLSCASSEMSAKGKVGMELNLDHVPLREIGMSPFEIMLSESQERMLVVIEEESKEALQKICSQWEVDSVLIGQTQKERKLKVYHQERLCAEIPVDSLVLGGGAPQYIPERRPSPEIKTRRNRSLKSLEQSSCLKDDLLSLLSSPNICSRRPIYEQYDSEVGIGRVVGPGRDSGVVRIPNTHRGLAVSTDCNPRYVFLDPYTGASSAVCEAARNVAVRGAKPIGITNCLNFGNPMIPENYYMFSESIRGISDACLALQIPVTGGNVSFYNESEDGPILPTPSIGMVGLIQDLKKVVPSCFQKSGSIIYLAGWFFPSLGGSEYLYDKKDGRIEGSPPSLSLEKELSLIAFLTESAEKRLLLSAHDLSLGGLAVSLLCSSLREETETFFDFHLHSPTLEKIIFSFQDIPDAKKTAQESVKGSSETPSGRPDSLFYFGETNSSAILSVAPEKQKELEDFSRGFDLSSSPFPLIPIGRVGSCEKIHSSEIQLDFGFFQLSAQDASKAYMNGLKGAL